MEASMIAKSEWEKHLKDVILAQSVQAGEIENEILYLIGG